MSKKYTVELRNPSGGLIRLAQIDRGTDLVLLEPDGGGAVFLFVCVSFSDPDDALHFVEVSQTLRLPASMESLPIPAGLDYPAPHPPPTVSVTLINHHDGNTTKILVDAIDRPQVVYLHNKIFVRFADESYHTPRRVSMVPSDGDGVCLP